MSGAGQRPRHVSSKPDVIVYGTGWCAATQIVRRFLAGKGIRYQYVDLENAPEAAEQLR
jgi:mycoredoxin